MYRIFLITTIFFATQCRGQNISDIAVSVFSKEQLFSKVLSNPEFIKTKIWTHRFSGDTLDFGVVVYREMFTSTGRTRIFSGSDEIYQITAYTIHDSIFLKRIDKIKYKNDSVKLKKEVLSILSVIDTTMLMAYIDKHNHKYNASWTLQDFLHPSSDYGFFGFLCGGYVPHTTEEAYSLAKLVKANDSTKLAALASSFSANDRAFGSTGLFFLYLKGQPLSEELLDLIETNQKSQIRISYCEGCLIGKQTLADALEAPNLKSLYGFLVSNKLL